MKKQNRCLSPVLSESAGLPAAVGHPLYLNDRYLAADGMENIIDILEGLEEERIQGIDFCGVKCLYRGMCRRRILY